METAIIARIRQIMQHFGLNAATFADKINIQRSALSHIFSERNKPSLDVIQKIIQVFPEVDINWLLTGKGSIISLTKNIEGVDLEESISSVVDVEANEFTNVTTPKNEPPGKMIDPNGEDLESNDQSERKKIEMITVFYSDKTFTTYYPDALPPTFS
jgi:DNA-binding XRE family transcriptional regulator